MVPPIASKIDLTLLGPVVTESQVERLLRDAEVYPFASICLPPFWAERVAPMLRAKPQAPRLGTVAGFPHGNQSLRAKRAEVERYIGAGIQEIDFVINISNLKEMRLKDVVLELISISDCCKSAGVTSKAIVETCYLNEAEKRAIFHWVRDFVPNLDFIKTSTGFGTRGAQLEDVYLWSEIRGDSPRPLIKAAGGIRRYSEAKRFLDAGADRIGTSAGLQIVKEYLSKEMDTGEQEVGRR